MDLAIKGWRWVGLLIRGRRWVGKVGGVGSGFNLASWILCFAVRTISRTRAKIITMDELI